MGRHVTAGHASACHDPKDLRAQRDMANVTRLAS